MEDKQNNSLEERINSEVVHLEVLKEMGKDIGKAVYYGIEIIYDIVKFIPHLAKKSAGVSFGVLKGVILEQLVSFYVPTACRKDLPQKYLKSYSQYIGFGVSACVDFCYTVVYGILTPCNLLLSGHVTENIAILKEIFPSIPLILLYGTSKISTNIISCTYEGLRKWYLYDKERILDREKK